MRRDGDCELEREEDRPRDFERETGREEGGLLPRGRPREGEGVRVLDDGVGIGEGLGDSLRLIELRLSNEPERCILAKTR